jgi:hypothetical protein
MKSDSIKKVVLGSAALAAAGSLAMPAKAATDAVSIEAIILAPVQITATQALNFGSLTEAGAGGTATVDNTGAITPGAGVTSIGGTIQAGGFTLKATAAMKVTVTAPTKVSITETVGGVAKMVVDKFTAQGAAGTLNATPLVHTMAAATDTGLDLGGRLTIGAAQLAGTYQGTVVLTANYQ